MQENYGTQDESQAFLCWNFALELEEEEFDESVKEDARAKKRRIQTELSKALACLGVKHSTFHSLLASGKKKEVKALLKKALVERTKDITDKEAAEEEFNIHLEVSDLTTTHEAYQFLLRRYVEEGRSSDNGTFLDMEKLKARHKRRLSLQPPTVENLISPETEEKRDKAFDKLKTFIKLKNEHDEEKKFEEATKIMKECLEVKPMRNKYNPNRRRSSILLNIQRDLDEEMDDLKLIKKRSGSRSRRNSSVGLSRKTSEEDLKSSTEALVLPPSKPRSRRGSTVELERKEFDGSTEVLTLPDIESKFQRSGSRKSKKKKKKNDPYPNRKGSFRRYSLAPEVLK